MSGMIDLKCSSTEAEDCTATLEVKEDQRIDEIVTRLKCIETLLKSHLDQTFGRSPRKFRW